MGYTKHDYQSNDILYAADLAEMDNQIYKNEQDILKLEENKQPAGNYASSEEVSQLRSDLDKITIEGEVHLNLSDEIYEYGRFDSVGKEINDGEILAFRSANYLKVIGGKTIKAIMGQNANFAANTPVQVIQYNSELEVIGERVELYATKSNGNATDTSKTPQELTLSDETVYIRFNVCNWGDVGALEDAKVGLYYLDDNIQDYLPYSETKTEIFLNAEKLKDFDGFNNGNRKSFSTIDSIKKESDFHVGDVLETLGYYENGDGGGAVYKVVSSLDSTTHQIALGNGLYASLVHDGVINVKQLGAYGNDSNDDSVVFQEAFNLSTKGVYIPSGAYRLESTVVVQNKESFIVHAEESKIARNKNGEYLFKFMNLHHCEFHFGEIVGRNSNGCIELYSDSLESSISYIDIYFKKFYSDTNCVYAHFGGNEEEGGYISEVRFYNGRLLAYSGQQYGVGFKVDNTSKNSADHFIFTNVGIEGIHTGFYFIGTEKTTDNISTKGIVEACEFFGCRIMENFTYVLKTEGTIRNCQFVGASYMYARYFDVSDETFGIMIYHPIMAEGGSRLAYYASIYNGVLIPYIEACYVRKNITPSVDYDLNTEADSFKRVHKYFLVNAVNKSLKLTNQYGRRFGHNKFYVQIDGINSDGFVVYDYDGNAIFTTPSTLLAPCLLSFEWVDDVGWIIAKVDTAI